MRSPPMNRKVPVLDVHGAFIPRTNWSGTKLRRADLSRADASGAQFRDADFLGARLVGTILRGADLTGALNLTVEQLAHAIIDESTQLPASIDRERVRRAADASPERAGAGT
ncbi:pentapeptide repeat-containing protein [uncultured Methylobacterium sp.]|uniref:pentapeptide repeat-containing protein n=1 Tax=uncultured Methylobacterium sp. TaxID=157278 RepID=UPI0035CA1A37